MPVHIGTHTYPTHRAAVAAIRAGKVRDSRGRRISNPHAYVAAIEARQGARHRRRHRA